jgi:flavin reductase (DIM6/NTAB) family NADH-FMN oxidoreductase RutF
VVVPTWPAQPDTELQSAIGTLLAALQPRQWVGCYDAFGGNDEAIDTVASQLRSLGQKSAFEPLRIRQVPGAADYQLCEEAGTDLGQLLTREKTIAAMKSLDGDLDRALGRLAGGLYVVTARQSDGDAERSSAMVASWVSQASFSPPGFTVAVAKDRSVETLLHVGDRFALNVLAAGREREPMKRFLRPFPPGADRFAGLETQVSPGGQPLLPEAVAWLEATVKQRMECGDHWVIYAEVGHGGLLDAKATTAVHQRRNGGSY